MKGRKFDIRSYMLVIAARPFVVLYHPGYLRLTCRAYDSSSSSLAVHLTNQFVQKQQEEYAEMREDTVRWAPGNLTCLRVSCGVVRCGVVWCSVMWCNVVWCGVMWCNVVWCNVVWCGAVQCGAVQ